MKLTISHNIGIQVKELKIEDNTNYYKTVFVCVSKVLMQLYKGWTISVKVLPLDKLTQSVHCIYNIYKYKNHFMK